MDKSNVMVGVGRCFEWGSTVTDVGVQNYIKKNTGAVISIKEIREAMDSLEFAGFIEIFAKDEFEYKAIKNNV